MERPEPEGIQIMTANQKSYIGPLAGVNQDTNLLPRELADCKNIIGEASGFSVWKGRSRYIDHSIGAQSGLFEATFPDQHKSLVAWGGGSLKVVESGNAYDLSIGNQEQIQEELDAVQQELSDVTGSIEAIIPDEIPDIVWTILRDSDDWVEALEAALPDPTILPAFVALGDRWRAADADVTRLTEQLALAAIQLNSDPRNPIHFTMFSRNRYLIGSNLLRDPAFSWDGNIDRDPLPIWTHGMRYSNVEVWGGRLWGMDAHDTNTDTMIPLYAFYGDIDKLEIKPGQWLEFRDNPLASRLVGMRPFTRDYAYFWADRGLWQVQLTGSWPIFVVPKLIHADCDCVSNASIVHIPGVGFAWRGLECYWLLAGGTVRRINLSNDARQANRIKDSIAACPLDSLHLIRGYYYKKRNLIIWSYPTNRCTTSNPWQNPQISAWSPPPRDTWWLLDQGYEGMVEIEHSGERVLLVTDQDGFLYIADSNIATDKLTDNLEWLVELEWIGGETNNTKWMWAILNRPFSGTDAVAVEFWSRYQSDAIEAEFTLDEAFDDISLQKTTYADGNYPAGSPSIGVLDTTGFPNDLYDVITYDDEGNVTGIRQIMGVLNLPEENVSYTSKTATTFVLSSVLTKALAEGALVQKRDYDPGGPNDAGLPPDAPAISKIPIRLMGEKLKIRLSNKYTDDDGNTAYYNGPGVPMTSLTVLSKGLPR